MTTKNTHTDAYTHIDIDTSASLRFSSSTNVVQIVALKQTNFIDSFRFRFTSSFLTHRRARDTGHIMSAISAQEYDALIYPGFLRRNVARWNDDGSAAPLSRARGPKGETFVLHLRSGEIDQDVSAIEGEVCGDLNDAIFFAFENVAVGGVRASRRSRGNGVFRWICD